MIAASGFPELEILLFLVVPAAILCATSIIAGVVVYILWKGFEYFLDLHKYDD